MYGSTCREEKLLQAFANDIAAVDVAGLVNSKTVDPVQLTGFFFSIDGLWDGPHLDQLAIGPKFHENLIFGRTAEWCARIFGVKRIIIFSKWNKSSTSKSRCLLLQRTHRRARHRAIILRLKSFCSAIQVWERLLSWRGWLAIS